MAKWSWKSEVYGNIDVGDECWRRNVLATPLRSWWRFRPFKESDTNIQKMSPISKFHPLQCRSQKLSPTTTCLWHLCSRSLLVKHVGLILLVVKYNAFSAIHSLDHYSNDSLVMMTHLWKTNKFKTRIKKQKVLSEMSHESFARIVECSHKMITKEVQEHFVPRKLLFTKISFFCEKG